MGPKECLQKMHVLGLPLVQPKDLWGKVEANVKLHGKWWFLSSREKSLQEWVDENKAILEPLPSDHYEYITSKVCFIEFHVLIPISLKECYNVSVTKSCRIQWIAPSHHEVQNLYMLQYALQLAWTQISCWLQDQSYKKVLVQESRYSFANIVILWSPKDLGMQRYRSQNSKMKCIALFDIFFPHFCRQPTILFEILLNLCSAQE